MATPIYNGRRRQIHLRRPPSWRRPPSTRCLRRRQLPAHCQPDTYAQSEPDRFSVTRANSDSDAYPNTTPTRLPARHLRPIPSPTASPSPARNSDFDAYSHANSVTHTTPIASPTPYNSYFNSKSDSHADTNSYPNTDT